MNSQYFVTVNSLEEMGRLRNQPNSSNYSFSEVQHIWVVSESMLIMQLSIKGLYSKLQDMLNTESKGYVEATFWISYT